jgi:hypothetical protein
MISDDGELGGDLGPYYGPFMQKLGDLSSQYELEKAALEQTMFRSLHEAQAGLRQQKTCKTKYL